MQLTVELLLFLAAGLVGGVLLGLIGVGMALITVPLLILSLPGFGFAAQEVPAIALATSMAVVSLGSVSSVISHHRKGNVDWRVVTTTVPASLAGIVLGSVVATHLPGQWLRLTFAAFLVYVAQRMLRRKPAAAMPPAGRTSPARYRVAGGAIGLAASVIGAGGGVLMVPFLAGRGHPMPRAVATSTAIGLPVSVAGALVYAAQPAAAPEPWLLGHLFLPAFLGLSAGSVLGAPFGARLASTLPSDTLKRGFGLVLLPVAAVIALGA